MNEAIATSILLGFYNIGLAATCIVMSIPLLKGHVKMNKIYGIRVRKAFESEEMWYKVNAYGAKRIIIWQLPLFVVGIVCFFIPIRGEQDLPWLIAFLLAPVVVWIPIIIDILKFCKKQA